MKTRPTPRSPSTITALLLATLCATCGLPGAKAAQNSASSAAKAAATPPATQAAPAKDAARKEIPRYTIEQFMANTAYFGASFSPNGSKILVGTNRTGVINAFAIPVGGGEPVRLTDSKVNAIQPLSYLPTDERFLYSSDQGGNEQNHIYLQSPDGTVRDLTPGEKLKAEFFGWPRDRKSFYFLTNERNPGAMDLYEMKLDGFTRHLLFECPEQRVVQAVSPDRRYVVTGVSRTSTDTDLYLQDRQTGESKLLTPKAEGEGEVANGAQAFTPDGHGLLYTTDRGSEFAYLLRYDLTTGERTSVFRSDWDVVFADYSDDERWFVIAINNDARTEVRLFDAATMKPAELPALKDADITGLVFSRDGKKMAFYAESSAPRNLFVRDLTTGKVDQLTQSLNKEIDPEVLVDAEVVRFKSYDGTVVPGLLYRPAGAGPANKVPAVISVHGGPGGQSRVGYSALGQFLVNHGYAVYSINNRGSSGYGKTFFAMDDRKHGEADLDDCVASKKMLVDTGFVDPARIGIMGGSYGGYMVLAALAFRPQEFVAGVDLYGVSNWLRTLESIPAWWGPIRDSLYKEMGDPVKDEAYLRRISPLFHADRIERPLIVLQGANDPRVLKVESDEIVAAVRKKGVPVEYLIFENEGHGFARKETQEKAFRGAFEFLEKHLKGAAATPPAQ